MATTLASTPHQAPATVIAESELTYIPPKQVEDPSFDQAISDVISEIEGEQAASARAEWEAENPLAEGQVEPKQPGAEGQETKPEVEVSPKPDPALQHGLDRLIQREVALQAREAQFAAQEGETARIRAELESLKSSVPTKDLVERFAHSPSEALKALGHDPATVVRVLIAEDLKARNQPVPPELQSFVEKAADRRELMALKAKMAERERQDEEARSYQSAQAAAQQEFNILSLGGQEYVKTHDKGQEWKQMPLLAELAKSNAERAHKEIMEEILRDARTRATADPNGKPITYQQAAGKVEARLADYRTLLSPTQTAAQTPGTKAAANNPQTPPQSKPPAKPLAPWKLRDTSIEDQGLNEAIREFNRLEAESRARR